MKPTSLVVLMPLGERRAASSARFRFVETRPGEPLRLPRLSSHEVLYIRGLHREVKRSDSASSANNVTLRY